MDAYTTSDFHKGDRVEVTHPKTGEVITGIVKSTNCKGGRISMAADDGKMKYTLVPRLLRKSAKPLPAVLVTPNPFVKGDRVEWTKQDGTVYHGTVKSTRNDRVTAFLDEKPGYQTSMPHSMFRKTDAPAPTVAKDDPSPMDAYSVVKYRIINIGHEGGAVKGTIAKNGIPVVQFEDGGYGGEMEFFPAKEQLPQVVDEFFAALLATHIQFGGKKENFSQSSDGDIWADWYYNKRETGRLWKDEVQEMQASSDRCAALRAEKGAA